MPTPSDEFQRALVAHGAVMAPVHGLFLPAGFGDVRREWRAAREGATVFAAGFRVMISATGEDRVVFLHGMLSQDVKPLAVGEGAYAAMLTQRGKVVSDLRVYVETERVLIDVVARRRAALEEALGRYVVADDVEFAACELQPLLGLEGPRARAVAGEVLGTAELPRNLYAHVRIGFGGATLMAVVASEIEGSGLLFAGPPAAAAELFDACVAAGAEPLGMEALEILRVEAGVPWAGVDMDEDTLLLEVGGTAAVSSTKGCYLGQEVVERVTARGHVNRHLIGLAMDGDTVPGAGACIRAGGIEVGRVTSAVRSQLLGRPIALAIVHRHHAAAGQRLAVDTPAGATAATVTAIPFAR